MSFEQKINYQLNKVPGVKKYIKRVYQRFMYAISPKIKSEGKIIRISPDDSRHEYFFGYYDKSPWDITDRYILCMRANDTWSDVSPEEKADILLIDTCLSENDPNRVKKIAETRSWNVQQGCMLQWLGPDFSSQILYNDYRNGNYVAVILELATGKERIIQAPVYTVSADGKIALTLDFSRLYNLRPGYGYYNVPEKTKDIALPDATAVWKINLETGEITDLFAYKDFATFQPRPEMQEKGAVHKVNHLMLSPNGRRCMVLYRWFVGQRKYTRLITFNIDGSDMYVLSDDDMVSHCFWKDDQTILAFENKKDGGPGYYLMTDKTQEYIHCWSQFSNDGHPSYSPDRKLIVTDSYPNRARVASINLMDGNERKTENTTIARVFASFKYDNDTRCDLHPRWSHRGDMICFDSVFEGHRGMYVVPVESNKDKGRELIKSGWKEDVKDNNLSVKFSVVTPVYNSFSLMKEYFKSLEGQNYKGFEVILVDDSSTDDSYKKLLEFQKMTELNLRVLTTEKNSGPGCARNIGMEAAKGEWIVFLDNDDWIEYSFLDEINTIIEKENVNCVIYDLYIQTDKKQYVSPSMYCGEEGICSVENAIKFARNHTVGKVYRLQNCRDRKVRFPELRRCEDIGFTSRAIEACGSVYYYKRPLYHYVQRASSLSNNTKLDERDLESAFRIIEKSLGEKYPEAVKNKSVTDLLYGGVLMMCKARKKRKEIRKFIVRYEEKYPDWTNAEVRKYLGKAKNFFLESVNRKMLFVLRAISLVHSICIRG
ncbi:MAG: glycosyltransferase [Lachnospiraceae bacterium]|nr:glycosyltransferase [Lachnospiraceae bacterium]